MAAANKSIKIKVEDLDAADENKAEKKPKTSGKKMAAKTAAPRAKKTVKKTLAKKPAVKKTASRDKIIEKKTKAEVKEEVSHFESGMTAAKAALAKEFENEQKENIDEDEDAVQSEEYSLIAKAREQNKKNKVEDNESDSLEDADGFEDEDTDIVLKVVDSANKEEDEAIQEVEKIRHSGHSLMLYRKIAYFFIFLTLALIAAVLYFALVKVKITIVPNEEKLSNNMIFDVYDSERSDVDNNAISGVVKKVNISHENFYEPSGEKIIGEETIGTITIVNNYTKNQQLVATTRLLSSGGILFRLKNTVNVPAGDKITAEVYADNPSRDAAIAPTKFTIPGLWAGIQDKIYAESSEAFVYRQKVEKHIQEIDIENAIRDLKQQLLAKTKSDISGDYSSYSQILYRLDDDSVKTSHTAKIGEKVDRFKISISADVVVVAFPEEKAKEIARQKFTTSLPQNKQVMAFDDDNIIYSLNSFDVNSGSATINSNFIGKVTLKENSEIIEINRILGLNNEQLRAYLSGLPELAGFEIEYFPSFIKRVPKLVDRVNIEIKK
jgi:hypothetical protein